LLPTLDGPEPVPQGADSDWHPADILAALKKRGYSLAGLSVANGYHATAAGKALKRSWPALEAVIAEAIGMKPEQIWPSRYAAIREFPSRRSRAIKKK
jgi:Ner family transcriptional regulator